MECTNKCLRTLLVVALAAVPLLALMTGAFAPAPPAVWAEEGLSPDSGNVTLVSDNITVDSSNGTEGPAQDELILDSDNLTVDSSNDTEEQVEELSDNASFELTFVDSSNTYEKIFTYDNGKQIVMTVFPLGPQPEMEPVADIPDMHVEGVTNSVSNVPAFRWAYGCSATSAAMLFGYYDRIGYSNMYTGPTNGSVCPMDNSIWGSTVYPSVTCYESPLSATHNGLDGRVTSGHVDDYWTDYGDAGPDPWVGNWPEHTQGDCTGDYMGTNQWKYGSPIDANYDGSTLFVTFIDGSPLTDADIINYGIEPTYRDGRYGMKLFAQSRGYTVLSGFSQRIQGYQGNPIGFTYANFQTEIDAGRPVLIHIYTSGVGGHTMLGYGYDTATNAIYVHDTWDYSAHSMTWGGTYGGMQHYSVSVIRLGISPPVVTNSSGATGITNDDATLNGVLTSTNGGTTTVRIYWGDNNGGTTAGNWDHVVNLGTKAVGAFSTGITGLCAATTYYYRCYAVNSAGGSWAGDTKSFMTDNGPPTISNASGATNITRTSARFNGTVCSTGGENPTVHIYWGTSDGGTTAGNWDNDVNLGAKAAGAFYTDNSSLTAGTTYYYRCYGENSEGPDWADATSNFTTKITLTLAVSGSGTTSPAIGGHDYTPGTVVNVSAMPAAGWHFKEWTGDTETISSNYTSNATITVNADITITANFGYALTMVVCGSGDTTPSPGVHVYTPGTVVNIFACADEEGWLFYKWVGDTSDNYSAAGGNVTMNAGKTVTAVFYRHAPLEWGQAFGNGATTDVLEEVIQTSDGGYAFTGYRPGPYGGNDAWTVKTNAGGNKTWENYYGGAGNDRGNAICQAADGRYVIAGLYTGGAPGDYLVFKTDTSGNVTGNNTWNRLIAADMAHSISRTADGGYITVGIKDGGAGSRDAYLVKLDSSGNTTQGYPIEVGVGEFSSENATVIQTADGGYAIFGSNETAPGNYNALLIKTDSNGVETFRRTYGGALNDFANSGRQTADGGYILAGSNNSTSYGDGPDAWLIKTNASGVVTWSKTYGGIGADEANCVIQTLDGGYALTGYTYSYSNDSNSDVWVIKTDSNGNITWHYTFSSANDTDDAGKSIRQASDGGLIIGADAGLDVKLLKLEGSTLNIAVSISGSGSATGAGSYDWGRTVTITATPSAGYQFVNWTGATVASATSSSTTIIMDNDYSITANFAVINQGGGGGGGGGGSSKTPYGTKTTTALRGAITGNGVTMNDIEARSDNTKATLLLPKGITAKNRVGAALIAVTITQLNSPDAPQAGATIIGTVYELGPDGATFDPYIYFTIEYDDRYLPEGITEEMLGMALWDDVTGTYVPIEYEIDTEANTLTCRVSHFSKYTILAAPHPAEFTLSGLTITPSTVYLGDSIDISVTVVNSGDLSGNCTANLTINRAVFATRNVAIGAGGRAVLDFTVPADKEGTYSVGIGGLTGTYRIILVPASFEISSLIISPDEVDIGQEVEISVTALNTGQADGVYEVKLNVNGDAIETKKVTMSGGESREVAFTFIPADAGKNTIEVNGLSGSLMVREKAAPPPPETTPTGEPSIEMHEQGTDSGSGTNWGLIFGIIAGCVVVAAGVLYFTWWRKRNSKAAGETPTQNNP